MTADELARALRLPAAAVERLVEEKAGISEDMALRLARHFGTSAEMWLNLQARRDAEGAGAGT